MRSSRGGDSSKRAEERIREVSRLANRLDDSSTAALVAALRDPSAYVAKLAVDALAERASYALCATLLGELEYFHRDGSKRDPGCYLRTGIVQILGKFEYLQAADAFRTGIKTVQVESIGGVSVDMGAQLRAASALGLAEIRDPNALRDITPLLFDTGSNGLVKIGGAVNAEIRVVAARAIGRLGSPAGLDILAIKLQFPGHMFEWEKEVLAECFESALTLGGCNALPLIAPYFHVSGVDLTVSAAMSIIRTGVEDGYSLVSEAIRSARGNDLRAICLTLASKRSLAAMTLLYDLAGSAREDERAAFAEAAGVTRDRGAVGALAVLASSDRSPKVRAIAAASLAAIGEH